MKSELPRGFPRDLGELARILSENGPLAKSWKRFEPRKEQVTMFLETARAFASGEVAVIEAGTGTGKTLAYLLPAIISRKKTIVSTGLKNLQEQINDKDLKFIRDHFDANFTSAVLKGRENYLCLSVYDKLRNRYGNKLELDGNVRKFAALSRWLQNTETGDLNELEGKFERKDTPFERLGSNSQKCPGRGCPRNNECFVTRARKEAAQSDIILVNHHLFMADLALREQGTAGILPDWEAAIFDEAHLLEATATSYFSRSVSLEELGKACGNLHDDMESVYGSKDVAANGILKLQGESVLRIIEDTGDLVSLMLTQKDSITKETFLWPKTDGNPWPETNGFFRECLMNAFPPLVKTAMIAGLFAGKSEESEHLAKTLAGILENLGFILENNDPTFVYQMKAADSDVVFEAIPFLVSKYLAKHLFNARKTMILTSATMAVGNSLDYFKEKMGIAENARSLVLPSPYDFKRNTLLYLPKHLPEPKGARSGYAEACAGEMEKILNVTDGRALVLFTSYKALNEVREILRKKFPFRIFAQDQKCSKGKILAAFRNDTHSVLFGTDSFWQGIDVPGESLSAVIIDKLPFPIPDLPVTVALDEYLKNSKKGNGFNNHALPVASIKLKQGLGRLIRSSADRGLLCVLDPRLNTKPYGKTLKKDFPPSTETSDFEDVKRFFGKGGKSGKSG
ncbi:MAG: ATP-dependent DNA helicase [Deltaproteobacteria bacterium]|jgi:ATP-dependent DNA helicase DinG|nr:ATP-dependent DNA helicase [Deltaproteobacteria bacterium]